MATGARRAPPPCVIPDVNIHGFRRTIRTRTARSVDWTARGARIARPDVDRGGAGDGPTDPAPRASAPACRGAAGGEEVRISGADPCALSRRCDLQGACGLGARAATGGGDVKANPIRRRHIGAWSLHLDGSPARPTRGWVATCPDCGQQVRWKGDHFNSRATRKNTKDALYRHVREHHKPGSAGR